jgi:hypothetical protein
MHLHTKAVQKEDVLKKRIKLINFYTSNYTATAIPHATPVRGPGGGCGCGVWGVWGGVGGGCGGCGGSTGTSDLGDRHTSGSENRNGGDSVASDID